MEHTTFAKKTVVLAALGALSLIAATVRAADETETEPTTSVNIAVEIGVTGATSIGSNVETSVTWATSGLKAFSMKTRASAASRSREIQMSTPLR